MSMYECERCHKDHFGVGHYCKECKTELKIQKLQSQLVLAKQYAARYQKLKRLLGHWQDGSNSVVTLSIDEATKTTFIKVNDTRHFVDGCGLDTVLDSIEEDL